MFSHNTSLTRPGYFKGSVEGLSTDFLKQTDLIPVLLRNSIRNALEFYREAHEIDVSVRNSDFDIAISIKRAGKTISNPGWFEFGSHVYVWFKNPIEGQNLLQEYVITIPEEVNDGETIEHEIYFEDLVVDTENLDKKANGKTFREDPNIAESSILPIPKTGTLTLDDYKSAYADSILEFVGPHSKNAKIYFRNAHEWEINGEARAKTLPKIPRGTITSYVKAVIETKNNDMCFAVFFLKEISLEGFSEDCHEIDFTVFFSRKGSQVFPDQKHRPAHRGHASGSRDPVVPTSRPHREKPAASSDGWIVA